LKYVMCFSFILGLSLYVLDIVFSVYHNGSDNLFRCVFYSRTFWGGIMMRFVGSVLLEYSYIF